MEALVERRDDFDDGTGVGDLGLLEAFGDSGDDFGEVFLERGGLDVLEEGGLRFRGNGCPEALDDGRVLFQRGI